MALGSSFLQQRAISPQPTQGRMPVADQQTSFAGGLNSISADDTLQPNQVRRADNGRLTQFGAFTKRGGTQITSTALSGTHKVQNGTTWYQSGGTAIPMAVSQGSLFTTSYGAFPLTWTQRGANGALDATITPAFASFISGSSTETIYIADGGLLNKYAGTTLTTNIAGTPSCSFICVHNQRLWGVGDATYPDSVFYSALNDGDSLGVGASGGGQIVDRTFGKSNMIGLCSLGTSLLMFHKTGISRLTGYGQSDITVSPAGISGDVGCPAPFSIVVVDTTAFFVTNRGLYAASEQGVSPVSTPQQPDPLSAILPQMSAANIANVRAVLNRGTRELWIMVPGYGVYVYHTILQAWSGPWADGYESPEVNCLFETLSAASYPIILAGDASGFVRLTDAPNLYLDNVASDGTGGTTYVASLQPRRFYCQQSAIDEAQGLLGQASIAKSFRFGYVLADLQGSTSSSLGYSTATDSATYPLAASSANTWGAAGTAWGTGTWGVSGQQSYRIQLSGNGYYIDLLYTDSGMAAPVVSEARVEGFSIGRR